MEWKLYLDDIRTPKDPTFVISRTVKDAQNLILTCGVPMFISFDHDLGMDNTLKVHPSGYDFAKWLVEMDMDGIISIPKNFTFIVHSANPVGAENIRIYLHTYMEFKYNEVKAQ
ncbi:cyclic-phosphate processing receiver domain-containing protein [Sulfuricurvum kujiense]|nr:cyclic-phosphate processing receiver domain-containing protein [Sulfuricurvum kujiense]